MEPNNNKKIVAIVLGVIVLALITVGFYYSYKARNGVRESFNPKEESTRGLDEVAQSIDVKHQYKEGIHTFAGEIVLPTPCDNLAVGANLDSVIANAVSLVFTTSNTSEVCAEVISSKKWKTSIVGPEDITVSGTLDGRMLRINIFEVPNGENIDTFEINSKG